MARINLSEGFTLIPEGTYVFQITTVNYNEAFGKMEVTMQTQTGEKHIERFTLLRANGKPNEGALNAFSYFAKTALNDFERTEIDDQELVGHFIECDVEHEVQENKNKPGQTVTFVRLADKRPSYGWKAPVSETTLPPKNAVPVAHTATPATAAKPTMDLKALLG